MAQATVTDAEGGHRPRLLSWSSSVLSLHGTDPRSGMPATWHVTALAEDATGTYLAERADGDIHSPAVWMQARRDAQVIGEDEVLELVRRVVFSDPQASE